MKLVIVDKNLPENICSQLGDRGFKIIKSQVLETLSGSTSSHPDIQVCKITDKKIIVEPSLFEYYKNSLEKYGIIVKSGQNKVEEGYPKDSYYNLAVNKNYALHRLDISDKVILEEIEKENICLVNVSQGYTKCNTAFTKKGLITSDISLYKKFPESKLLISPGRISLQGYNYGFIGGASGYFSGSIYFIGKITDHPDYEKIKSFLEEEKTSIIELGSEKLWDYGSLIFLQGGQNE